VFVVAGDLVLEVSEESSLLLLLVAFLINNPFLVFKEMAILLKGLVDSCGASMAPSGMAFGSLGGSD